MFTLEETSLRPLAYASCATARIIEAHTDRHDTICRVVLEIGDAMRNIQLREAILQLWMQDGFMASASRDGCHLFIDGLIHQETESDMDLVAVVAYQIKEYSKQSAQVKATDLPNEPDELSLMPHGAVDGKLTLNS